jgi:hypothetical protein
MTTFRVICYEPASNTVLFHIQSKDFAEADTLFKKDLDETYLLKVKLAMPQAVSVVVRMDQREEITDWVEIASKVEFL